MDLLLCPLVQFNDCEAAAEGFKFELSWVIKYEQSKHSWTCFGCILNLYGIFWANGGKALSSTDRFHIFQFLVVSFSEVNCGFKVQFPTQAEPSLTFEFIFYFDGSP